MFVHAAKLGDGKYMEQGGKEGGMVLQVTVAG